MPKTASGFRRFLRTWGRRPARLALLLLLTGGALGCAKKTPEEKLQEAQELLQARDIYGAELKLQDIIENHADSPLATEAQFMLAHCYQADGRIDEARAAFDKTIQMAGGVQTEIGFAALFTKIQSTYGPKQPDGPAKALEELLATSATIATADESIRERYKQMLASLYDLNNRDTEALALLKEIGLKPPANPVHLDAMRAIENIYRRTNQLEKALEFNDQYAAAFPETPFARMFRFRNATLLEELGRPGEAAPIFTQLENEILDAEKKAIGTEEKAAALVELATFYSARGNKDAARTVYRQLLKDYGMSRARGEAVFGLARIELDTGRTSEALALYRMVMQEAPNTEAAQAAAQFVQAIQSGQIGTSATLTTTGTLATAGEPLTTDTLEAKPAATQDTPTSSAAAQ